MTIDDCSSLFATICHCSPLFALFETIRTIRDYSLFAIRDYSLFAVRVFQTPLPPAVYSNANPNATARVLFPADQVEQTPTASSEMRSVVSDVSVLSFVSARDATVPQLSCASAADFNQVEESRAIRMTVIMMPILSQKNWLLVNSQHEKANLRWLKGHVNVT